MSASYDVGTAHVTIEPSFRGFAAKVQAEVDKVARQIEAKLSAAVSAGLNGGTAGAARQGGQAGTAYGQSFADTVRARVSAALKNLPQPMVNVNSTPAERKIADLRTQLRTLQANVGVSIDSQEALARVEQISAELKALTANDPSVDVRVNTARATAQLATLQAELDEVDKPHTVDIRLEGGFAQRVRAQVQAALSNLPTGLVDLDTGKANTQLEDLRARLEAFGGKTIGVDISAGDAKAELAALQAELSALNGKNASIDIRIDAARAEAELAALTAEITALDAESVDVDTTRAVGSFGALMAAGVALAPALIPIGAAITAAFAGVAVALAGLVAAFGVVALALAPVIKAVAALSQEHKKAGQAAATSAKQQADAAFQVQSAQQQVASAEASLTQARANAASQSVQAAERVKSAQQGVADAEQSAAASAEQSAERQRAAAEAVANAQQSLTDARRQAAVAAEQSAERERQAAQQVASAQQSLADARDQAQQAAVQSARSITDALQRQQDAERSLADVQAQQITLQQKLTDARAQARREIEDLNNAVKDSALSERQASLDLEDAQQRLAALQGGGLSAAEQAHNALLGLPTVSIAPDPQALAQAQLAVDQAKQRVDEAKQAADRAKQDAAKANKAGVEGSDPVQAAKKAIADNRQAQVDAEKRVKDAVQGVTDARAAAARQAKQSAEQIRKAEQGVTDAVHAQQIAHRDAARQAQQSAEQVRKAEQGVTDAIRAQAQARRDAARQAQQSAEQVQKAEQGVVDARRAQTDQRRQSAFSVSQAQQGVTNAQRNLTHAKANQAQVAAKAATGRNGAADPLAGLPPAAVAFVQFIETKLKPALKGLSTVAAQGFLPGLQSGLSALLPLMPQVKVLVGAVAKTLGDMAASAGKALGGPGGQKFLTTMTTMLPGVLRTMGSIVGNLSSAFGHLFLAVIPLGLQFGDVLDRGSKAFAGWTRNLGHNKGFQGFLEYARESLPIVGKFLGNLFGAIGNIIRVAAPFGALLLGLLNEILGWVAKMPPGLLAGIFIALGIALAALTSPISLTIIAFTAIGIGITYLIAHFGGLGKAIKDEFLLNVQKIVSVVTTVFRAVVAAAKWLYDVLVGHSIIPDLIRAIIGWFQALFGPVTRAWNAVTGFLRTASLAVLAFLRDHWKLLLGILTGPMGLAVAAIIRHWTSIRNTFTAAWNWVKSAFARSWDGVRAVLGNPLNSARAAIGGTWSGIRGAFSAAVSWVRGAFSKSWSAVKGILTGPLNAAGDALGSWKSGTGIFGRMKDAFNAVVSGISKAWGALQQVFRAPVLFLVDTVLNNGLIRAFNFVSDKLGGPHIGNISDAQLKPRSLQNPNGYMFASGGVLPGYTPGRDVHRFYSPTAGTLDLSGGETILRPEFTAAAGVDWVNQANAAARSGGIAGARRFLGGFAGGGVLGSIWGGVKAGAGAVKGAAVKAWDIATDPLAYIKKVIADLGGLVTSRLGDNALTRLVASVPAKLAGALVDKITGMSSSMFTTGGGAAGAVWNALLSRGFTGAQAAGVMGNIQAESGYDPTIVQGGGHSLNPAAGGPNKGYGLVQWTPGSKLLPYLNGQAPSVGSEIGALAAQLAGQGPYPEAAAGAALRRAMTPSEAARVFGLMYERYKGGRQVGRERAAEQVFAQFGRGGGASALPGGAGQSLGHGLFRPVRGGRLAQGLHDAYTGFPAIDIGVPVGTPVYAGASGRVTKSYDIPGFEPRNATQNGYKSYGRIIQILSDGFSTLYAHLSQRGVNVGAHVSGGQVIGLSGNTGNSRGPHLHFGAQGISATKFYDSGGLLEPGFTLAYNGTGKPEPVFTHGQAQALLGGQSGTSRDLHLHYNAAQGRSLAQDDFLEAAARARVLTAGLI